jgi:hypothetical protein
METSFITKLYSEQRRCLHLESYQIWVPILGAVCGACHIRNGVLDELPTRTTIHQESGLFGAPETDPRLIEHVMVTAGLVPPAPDMPLREFKRIRRIQSKPNWKQFPFTTALWELMGIQPPLARVLVEFCKGYNEIEVSERLDLSPFNVCTRMRKAVQVTRKYLKVDHAAVS